MDLINDKKNDEKFVKVLEKRFNNLCYYRNTIGVKEDLLKLKKIFPDFNEVIDYIIPYVELSEKSKNKILKLPNIILISDDVCYVDFFAECLSNIIFNKPAPSLGVYQFQQHEAFESVGSVISKDKLLKYPNSIVSFFDILSFLSTNTDINIIENIKNWLLTSSLFSKLWLIFSVDIENIKSNTSNFSLKKFQKDLKDENRDVLNELIHSYANKEKLGNNWFLYNKNLNFFGGNYKKFFIKRNNIKKIIEYTISSGEFLIPKCQIKLSQLTELDYQDLNVCFKYKSIYHITMTLKEHIRNKFNQNCILEYTYTQKDIQDILKNHPNYFLVKINQSLVRIKSLKNEYDLFINEVKKIISYLDIDKYNLIYCLDVKISAQIRKIIKEKEIEFKDIIFDSLIEFAKNQYKNQSDKKPDYNDIISRVDSIYNYFINQGQESNNNNYPIIYNTKNN